MDVITLALAKNFTKKIKASGISDVSYDESTSKITANYVTTEGTKTLEYTIPTLKGRSITDVIINDDYNLVITYDDGEVVTIEKSIRGPQGEKGVPGDMVDKKLYSPDGTAIYDGSTSTVALNFSQVKDFVDNSAYRTTLIYKTNYILAPESSSNSLVSFASEEVVSNKKYTYRITIDSTGKVTKAENEVASVVSVAATGTSTQTAKYITVGGTEWKIESDVAVVDNLTTQDATKALSANQGYELNTKLSKKADLDENNKVKISQLPSFIMAEVVEGYATKDDKQPYSSTEVPTAFYKEATHETLIEPQSVKTYVDITPNTETITNYGRSFRWIGNKYIELSNQSQEYYSLEPSATTMGAFREAINNVNAGGSHVFLDLHQFIDDAYVCTAHFWNAKVDTTTTYYCQILDFLHHDIIFNPKGYATQEDGGSIVGDDTLIKTYCNTVSNKWGSYATTTITDTSITMGGIRELINNINAQGMHVFLDLSKFLSEAYVCTIHCWTNNSVNYCQILDLLNHRVVINTAGYTDTTTLSAYCSNNQWSTARDIQIDGVSIIENEIANISSQQLRFIDADGVSNILNVLVK